MFQGEDALAMPFQAVEDILHPPKPLDFFLKAQILGDETDLRGSVESYLQSPPSDQLSSSLTLHKLQQSENKSTFMGSERLKTKQFKNHLIQEVQLPKLHKPEISEYLPKTKSTLIATTHWDSCSSTSPSSQFDSPLVQCQSPALPASFNSKLSRSHPERYQTRVNPLNSLLPSQSEEGRKNRTKSFSQQGFKPANKLMENQISQSPPSDKHSSLMSHECKKLDCSAFLNSSAPALVTPHQQEEHTPQKALLPGHNNFYKTQMVEGPSSPQSKSAMDWDSSLSLSSQAHSPLLSSLEIPASILPKQRPISPADQCSTTYAKVTDPPLSRPIQAKEDKGMLTQLSQSPRLAYFNKLQTPRSSLNTTAEQSLDSTFTPQSHGPSPSTSIQCLSPTFSISSKVKLSPTPSELYHIRAKALTPQSTKSSSQTQSGNTPSQSQPPSERQKSPLSTEQPSSNDEEAYFLGSSSSSEELESLKSSLPLCLSSSSEYNLPPHYSQSFLGNIKLYIQIICNSHIK